MHWFVGGLILFFVLHLVTLTPWLRRAIVARVGENSWKGAMAIGSLLGIALTVVGWSEAPNTQLFAPSALAIRLAPWLVSLALILFVIGGVGLPGHIRRNLHHPMLIGVALWSATHLLANGGWRESVLFGAFLLFSVYALLSLWLAGKRARHLAAVKWDVIGIVVGLLLAVGVMHGHRWLFGIAIA